MPIAALLCECGHRWETVTGNTVSFGNLTCEKCGKEGQKQFGGASMLKGFDYDALLLGTPEANLELQHVMRNKRWLEQHESERDSGWVDVKESGPNWTRPHNNESRRRIY